MSKPGWRIAVAASAVASAVALLLQSVARGEWQIRTLPERVMEWLLVFVPLDLFERGVGQFGGNAKDIALDGTIVGMLLLLFGLGLLVLRLGFTSGQLVGIGVGLWLLTMAVVMPVTGAGFFATGLLMSPLLTGSAYALAFLAYGAVLAFARLRVRRSRYRRAELRAERRAMLVGLAGALVAGGLSRALGRDGGFVSSSLPVAAAPTQPATAEPITSAESSPTPTRGTTGAVLSDTRTPEPPPRPAPARQLRRTQDGSLTAAGRPKGQLAPTITGNDDFYIVTKNAVADPVVELASWRLVLDGEMNQPAQLDYRTLRALPPVLVTKTLECISNLTAACDQTSYGCDLISTARWRGARLSDVLALAGGLKPAASVLAFLSVDEFSAALPVDVASDREALLVYEMNDQPLPREHGYPVRLLVPGRYGMKNPKWLVGVRAMSQSYLDWYGQRNWNPDGIVKTMSRIDVPVDGAILPAGQQHAAGIAYAGDRGLSAVEVSTNHGATWQAASFLEPMPGKDAMVRWQTTFQLLHGQDLTLTVRATDRNGMMQTDEFQLPQPDGASGQDAITVKGA